MSTFNSFAMCIILVLYGSVISAAPSLIDSIGSDIEQGLDHITGKIATATDAVLHTCAKCSAQTLNDTPCLLETYKLLLQSFISNSDLQKPKKKIRDDYLYTPNVGLHKLHTRGTNWNTARKRCIQEGGHLAIINSQDEVRVLSELYNQTGSVKDSKIASIAYVGIHDNFVEGDWVTVLDASLASTGFSKWSDLWDGQPNNVDTENCGVFVRFDESLADNACNVILPFFCELPMDNDC